MKVSLNLVHDVKEFLCSVFHAYYILMFSFIKELLIKRLYKLHRGSTGGNHRLLTSARKSRIKKGKSLVHGGCQRPLILRNQDLQQKSYNSISRNNLCRSTLTTSSANGPRKPLKNDTDNSDEGKILKKLALIARQSIQFIHQAFID